MDCCRKAHAISWPETLKAGTYETERTRIEKRIPQAVDQAKKGEVAAAVTGELSTALKKLHERLDEHVDELTPDQFLEAKRYLRRLDWAVKALRQKRVRDYFTAVVEIPVKCPTVRDLVQYLTEKKLRFAPAVMGDETAYVDLHKAMTEYIKKAQAAIRRFVVLLSSTGSASCSVLHDFADRLRDALHSRTFAALRCGRVCCSRCRPSTC